MVGTLIRRPLPPVSDFIRTLLDDVDATAALTTLGITTGTWMPTLTATTNIDATTAYQLPYTQIGARVICSVYIDADATLAASTATEVQMSLPVASDLSSPTQLTGVAAASTMTVRIVGDIATNRARLLWNSASTANFGFAGVFHYQVL